jgi:sugar lactone lactonase YvrE
MPIFTKECTKMHNRVFAALVLALVGTGSLSGQVIVSDWGGRLQNYDPNGNSTTTINGTLAQPTGMVYGPDGFLYVSDIGTNTVNKYNATTGAFVSTVLSSAQLGSGFEPTGLAFAPGGDLLVSKQASFPTATPGTGGVYRYNFGTMALTPMITNLTQGEGLLMVGSNLYIAELNNYSGRVLKYDFVNAPTTFIANGQGGLGAATSMAIGPDGQMYVSDILGMAILRYQVNNPNVSSTFASGTGFNSPTGVAFYGGHMFVSNFGSGSAPDGFMSEFDWTTGAFQANVVNGLFAGSAVVTVPEPASFVLIGLPAGMFVVRRIRRKSNQ